MVGRQPSDGETPPSVTSTRTRRSKGSIPVDVTLKTSSIGQTTWFQWFTLGLIVTIFPYYLSKLHYSLPELQPPVGKNGPQPSEELILGHIRELETIGYRTVGTPQAREGEVYVENEARKLQRICEKNGVLDCDLWVQVGDGFHEFSIMDHDVLKVYRGVRNIILKIRAKNPSSGPKRVQKDAILLGSHIDSTLPAPGAADDGIGVGVMLDVARVLIERNQPFDNSVIFMWNGAEETLQDGSHLYSKRHHTAKEVRAVINLEAAGTTGGAMLFQATSKEMIDAFSHAPHPRGTVVAADVFASGVLMSDTDFVQFEQYLNISGLDMALVGHSYFYHTQKDRLEFIEIGAAQHFGNNVQAILDYLLSPSSPLSSPREFSPPNTVYLTLYDRFFFSYSMETATKVYSALSAIAFALVMARLPWNKRAIIVRSFGGTFLGFFGGIISANVVAGVMVLLNRQLSWFKHEHLCLVLFAPAAYIGNLGTQLALSRGASPSDRAVMEPTYLYAQLLFSTIGMLLLQSLGIRSAYLFAVLTGVSLIGLLSDEVLRALTGRTARVGFWYNYAVPLALYMIVAVEGITTTLDIFTPLVGRMGKDAPAEFIIATISSSTSFIFFPTVLPLFHRLTRPAQYRVTRALSIFVVCAIILFAGPWWKTYDSMHPQRTALQFTYNHTSLEHTAHVAYMDSGPQTDFLAAVHDRYGTESPIVPTRMNKENNDWDVLYPISSFLETYRFDLAPTNFAWPKMGIEVKETKLDGQRILDLKLDFTGLVWPTLAFTAEILDWSFDFDPPKGYKRHHIKVATGVETPIVDLSLTIADTSTDQPLSIHWVAIDVNQMVPGTASRYGPDMPGSKVLIDLQGWAKERYDDSLEILTYAAVAGVVEV